MQSIDLIRYGLRRSEDIVLAKIGDMREHCMVLPTPNGGAHTLWVLGHLAYIEALVIRHFALGEENPLAEWGSVFDGDHILTDARYFPSFDVVLESCRSVRAGTLAVLDSIAEEDLDQPGRNVPAAAQELFGSWRQCFAYAPEHWYMHRGQLADARRAAGIGRMWY